MEVNNENNFMDLQLIKYRISDLLKYTIMSVCIIIVILLAVSFWYPPAAFITFFIIFLSVIPLFIFAQLNLIKNYVTVGKIRFEDNSIYIQTNLFSKEFCLNKTRITIGYNGFEGLTIGQYPSNGNKNSISVTENGKSLKYTFLLESDSEFEELKRIMKLWYNNKYSFKETGIGGLSSYLFETGLSYKELSEKKDANKS